MLSVSRIKTYNGSKSKFAGRYILGVKDNFESDALPLGILFEHRLFTKEDKYDLFDEGDIVDLEQMMTDYDNLKYNAQGLDVEIGELQYEIRGELFGLPFLGYVDNLTDERVEDIKTARYLSKPDSKTPNSWSGMSYYEEYELQLWLYMKLLNRKKGRILEYSKHRYKDGRAANQVIEFHWTDERDKQMTEKWLPVVDQIKEMYKTYENILHSKLDEGDTK